MSEKRKIDTRESVRVVTSNDFITACGLDGISLKARKLLYIAVAQCRKSDTEFYEQEMTAVEFANMMGISPSHVYEEADRITDELMHGFLKIGSEKSKRAFKKFSIFNVCEYTENATLKFKLNKDMTDFLLGITKDFSQPLLDDFLKMNSPYSMAIWHLMQREMHSKKAYGVYTIEFDLSLDELRQVTGTQDKLKQLVEFKRRVLDKAIREIKDNCGEVITYENIKSGRTVTGFHFKVVCQHYIEPSKLSQKNKERLKKYFENHEPLKGQLTTDDLGF